MTATTMGLTVLLSDAKERSHSATMKLFTAFLYLFTRRKSRRSDFERLYCLHPDPFGVENYPYEQKKIERVMKWFFGQHFRHILDIGCGAGTLTRQIARCADAVTAIDYSSKAIKRAQEHRNPENITYYCEDLLTFPFEHSDLILCSEILYYLSPVDLVTLIDRMKKSQPGSIFISIGKVGEDVDTILEQHFMLIERIEERRNRRPYAISVYKIKAAE